MSRAGTRKTALARAAALSQTTGGVSLPEFQRRMLAAFPRGTRTPQRLLGLWDAVWAAGGRVAKEWQRVKPTIDEPGTVQRLTRELKQWQQRMLGYRRVLVSSTTEAEVTPTVVNGFLFSVPGSGNVVADALFTLYFARQIGVLLESETQRFDAFFADAARAAKDLLNKAGETAQTVVDLRGFLWAVAATVAGGVILNVVLTRK